MRNNMQAIGYKVATAVSCAALIGVFNLVGEFQESKYKEVREQLRQECLAFGGAFNAEASFVASKLVTGTRPTCAH